MTTSPDEQGTDPTDDLDTPEDPPEEENADDGDSPDGDAADDDENKATSTAEGDKFVVNLGEADDTEDDDEEPPPNDEPKAQHRWKELKAAEKEAKRLKAELAELKAKGAPAAPPAVKKPGPRPTLKDVEHDEEKLAQAIIAHAKETEAYEAEQKKAQDAQETLAAAYRAKVAKVGHPKYKQYEKAVDSALSPVQAGLLLAKTKDTAEIVVGLGQNPAKLAELAAISDPVDFAFALRDLEKNKTVKQRKPSTQPESVVRGGSGPSHDETLKRLEAEADRTGNRAPIQRYKEQMRERQRKK